MYHQDNICGSLGSAQKAFLFIPQWWVRDQTEMKENYH